MKNTTTISFKPLTSADGNRAEALNVRPCGEWMEVVGEAAAVCPKTSDDVLLGIDRRGNRTYYFMQRRHRTVSVAGYSQNGMFATIGVDLLDAEGDVYGFAVTGDFVVLSTAKGLRYLHYNGSGYESLGGTVEMPVFAFGTTESATVATDVPGFVLKSSYRQWTGTLAASDRSTVERTFMQSVTQLQRMAEAGGGCLQPIAVRVALRLWDDSRLWSDAVVGLGCAWQPEVVADAESGDSWTIAPATLRATTWRPTLRLVNAGIGGWQPFVKAVEIYATDECQNFGVVRIRCERSQSGQPSYYLRMRAENDAAQLLRQAAETATMRLVATITDIPSLVAGKVVAANVSDLGGGEWAINVERTATAEWQPAPRQFVAKMLSAVGTSVFAGNLESRLPEPPHYMELVDASALVSGMASTYVSVEVSTSSGNMTVTRSALLESYSLRTTNIIAYPDSRARRLTVIVVAGGQRHSLAVDLTPAAEGNYAYATRDGGFALQLSSATSVPATSSATISQPTVLLHSNGNPLQWTACGNADNTGIVGVLPSMRYGSSWVVGRSPVCLFSADGIRLLSFDTAGRCTASTRVSRHVVADPLLAAVTDNGIAFVDSYGQLCRYRGQRVEPTGIVVDGARGAVYDHVHGELLIYGGRQTIAVSADDTFTHRTAAFLSHADGMPFDHNNVYDVNQETARTMAVELRTPQMALPFLLRLAEWRIDAADADVVVAVYGENGYSCHGEATCRMRLRGALLAAVRQRVAARRIASVRLGMSGTLPTGSRICRIKMS